MKQQVQEWVKRAFRRFGLDVRHAGPHDALGVQQHLLGGLEVATVVDAGAFHGEWTGYYRRAFPAATVWAFEPFPDSQGVIAAAFGADPQVRLVPQALGREAGERVLRVNQNAATNSLLPTAPAAAALLRDPRWVAPAGEVRVPVTTLDDFCAAQKIDRVNLLKLDVQGAEGDVLAGAAGLLARGAVDLIYAELNVAPQYVGQAEYFDVCRQLHTAGYPLWGLYNFALKSPGRLCWADGIFAGPRVAARAMPGAG